MDRAQGAQRRVGVRLGGDAAAVCATGVRRSTFAVRRAPFAIPPADGRVFALKASNLQRRRPRRFRRPFEFDHIPFRIEKIQRLPEAVRTVSAPFFTQPLSSDNYFCRWRQLDLPVFDG
jgi:hypothetical protein